MASLEMIRPRARRGTGDPFRRTSGARGLGRKATKGVCTTTALKQVKHNKKIGLTTIRKMFLNVIVDNSWSILGSSWNSKILQRHEKTWEGDHDREGF